MDLRIFKTLGAALAGLTLLFVIFLISATPNTANANDPDTCEPVTIVCTDVLAEEHHDTCEGKCEDYCEPQDADCEAPCEEQCIADCCGGAPPPTPTPSPTPDGGGDNNGGGGDNTGGGGETPQCADPNGVSGGAGGCSGGSQCANLLAGNFDPMQVGIWLALIMGPGAIVGMIRRKITRR